MPTHVYVTRRLRGPYRDHMYNVAGEQIQLNVTCWHTSPDNHYIHDIKYNIIVPATSTLRQNFKALKAAWPFELKKGILISSVRMSQ